MKFVRHAPPPGEPGVALRWRSEGNVLEVRVTRVMFGYRVQLCQVGDVWNICDWCGGNVASSVSTLVGAMVSILESRSEEGLPALPRISDIKPWLLDMVFVNRLLSLGAVMSDRFHAEVVAGIRVWESLHGEHFEELNAVGVPAERLEEG